MSNLYLKILMLLIVSLFVGIIAFKDWNNNKKILVYFLLFLFAQTGFSYDFKPGYRTSFAEIIYFMLLLYMTLIWIRDSSSIPDIKMKGPISFYLLVSTIGIITAIIFDIRPSNIFVEVKSYVVYIFYIHLIAFFIKDKADIKKCLYAFIIFSIIPLFFALKNITALPVLIETERVGIAGHWGTQNILIGYLLPVIFISITLSNIALNKLTKGIFLLFAGFSIFALFLSQTRTGWVAFSVSFVVFSILNRKKIKYLILLICCVLTLMIIGKFDFIHSVFKHRVMEETIDKPDSSLKKRFARWNIAIATFKKYPMTGSGWGSYLIPIGNGEVSSISWPALPRWHCSFFEILSQLGLFGILAYYWIWLRIGKFALRGLKFAADSEDRIILGGLISAVISVFIYSLGEQQFYRIETASVSWCLVGFMIAHARFIINPSTEFS